MSKISDTIEKFIKERMDESRAIEIKRNELALFFNCAPSQINYVVATRFNSDRGYYVESRRGGGGYVKIIRIQLDKNLYIKETIDKKIAEEISYAHSKKVVKNLIEREIITSRDAKIIFAAINERVLNINSEGLTNRLRANILKSILINLLS